MNYGAHNLTDRLRLRGLALAAVFSLLAASSSLRAQGIFTVVPTRSVNVSAGTGAVGYSGDGSAAASATLASPSAVAYDANGNLFLADAQNHVVREVSAGVMTTVAGTGIASFGGDNGPATAAFLDTPTGVAVDASGNLYIADSHNHRIRKVSGGIITTIAGNGTPGFSGDNASAPAGQLFNPTGIAVGANGILYIADTNNQRIRSVFKGTIATVAGNGDQLFAGDGGPATAASLDTPTGVAVDASGNIYIADRHNQRIRIVSAGGTIQTFAGSGGASFAGGFSGDGANPTASTLSLPTGVSIDAAGNIYIADTGNQRIREIGGGAIATIVGSGQQGFGGDTGAPGGTNLSHPRAVSADAAGNLSIADKLNERVRAATLPTLIYTSDGVGVLSPPQSVALSNTGTAPITVSTVTFTGSFTVATGGTCTVPPVTLAAGATCTQNISFLPNTIGPATGSVVFSGSGIVPQTVLLTGSGIQTATTTVLNVTPNPADLHQSVTLSAIVSLTGGAVPPTGSVIFKDGAVTLATTVLTPSTQNASVATFTSAAFLGGIHSITATYVPGATGFAASGAGPVVLTILLPDFTPDISISSLTIETEHHASLDITVHSVNGFTGFVNLSCGTVPEYLTCEFVPDTLFLTAAGNATSHLTIDTDALHGFRSSVKPMPQPGRRNLPGGLAFALLLPLAFFGIRRGSRLRSRGMSALLLAVLAVIAMGLTACGSKYPGHTAPGTYTIAITATGTAQGTITPVTHTVNLTLTVTQ